MRDIKFLSASYILSCGPQERKEKRWKVLMPPHLISCPPSPHMPVTVPRKLSDLFFFITQFQAAGSKTYELLWQY